MALKPVTEALCLFSALLTLFTSAACGGTSSKAPKTDAQACAALEGAASTLVPAVAFDGGPGPLLTTSATSRYDVTLPASAAPGAFGGNVRWQVEQQGQYGIYAGQSVTFLVRNQVGNIMPFLKSLGSSLDCESVGRHVFIELPPGTYTLELGPTTVPDVKLVLLPMVAGEEI